MLKLTHNSFGFFFLSTINSGSSLCIIQAFVRTVHRPRQILELNTWIGPVKLTRGLGYIKGP
jgi:hypothetical protein